MNPVAFFVANYPPLAESDPKYITADNNYERMLNLELRTKKLVIFDLDGTLINAYPAIIESVNSTLTAFGYHRQKASVIRRAVGRGDRKLLESFVPGENSDALLAYYRKHHAKALLRGSRLCAGAQSILEYLTKKRYILAVASNRPTRFSRIILRHLQIRSYFKYVLCADVLKAGKPDPAILRLIMRRFKAHRQETVFVGDMVIDAQTARAAGVTMILVRGGSSSYAELLAQKPYRIIRRISLLRKIL
ncbi:MAG TPA: HAD family hydrolase [Candidatus Omnitrophota bacterium]|nr:HAD family hydrolase [Candidatus Omnitrophota bacterium]